MNTQNDIILNTFTATSLGKHTRQKETYQEGWVVAYADLITLLFIFFSLLLSMSVISKAKFSLMTNQFNRSSTTDLVSIKNQIDAAIEKQALGRDVTTDINDEGLSIQFSEAILFPSALAELNDSGKQVLSSFIGILRGIDKSFFLTVEGHTDNRPIHTTIFPSNWELSATRGVNVLHFLTSLGIDEKRMMVRAFADTRPVAERTTALQGTARNVVQDQVSGVVLARNRRVTLLIH